MLADLIEVDWSVEISREGFIINPPRFGSNSEDKLKARESNLNAAHTDIDNPIDAKFIRKLRYPPIGSKIKSIDTSKDFQLNDAVFKVAMNSQAVYQSVVAEMNNARQGTSSTKNRELMKVLWGWNLP